MNQTLFYGIFTTAASRENAKPPADKAGGLPSCFSTLRFYLKHNSQSCGTSKEEKSRNCSDDSIIGPIEAARACVGRACTRPAQHGDLRHARRTIPAVLLRVPTNTKTAVRTTTPNNVLVRPLPRRNTAVMV